MASGEACSAIYVKFAVVVVQREDGEEGGASLNGRIHAIVF
jgi:hypothetical protein